MVDFIYKFSLIRIRDFFAAAKVGFRLFNYDYFKTIGQGASTQTLASTTPEFNDMGGVFLEDNNISVAILADSNSRFGIRPWAIDKKQAKRL